MDTQRPAKVTKSDAEWQAELTPEQYRVLRQKGTEGGGGDEPEELEATARALGVAVDIVGAGDHFETFAEVDLLVPLVLAHLERSGVS